MNDPVKPKHYYPKDDSDIHCHTAQKAALGIDGFCDYMIGCAIKYQWRWRSKNGVEDLKKAKECLSIVISELESEIPIGTL